MAPGQSIEAPAPPRWLLRFAHIAILGAAAFWVVVFAYALLVGRAGLWRAVPLILSALLLSCLWLPAVPKVNLAIAFVSSAVGLYVVELCLTFIWTPLPPKTFKGLPQRRDYRSALEVVADLRAQGVDAHASLFGRLPLVLGQSTLRAEGGEILPLGGISGRRTVLCNETGQYVTYVSDERGYNNPRGIWSRERIAIVALGDSFTQGVCVPTDRGFVALLRERYPATLNLGMAGSGPLLELAAVEEYVASMSPRIVLWFFFEANDLTDLRAERASPLLMRYLGGGLRQGLIDKQPDIDRAWERFEAGLRSEWAARQSALFWPALMSWLNDVLVEHRDRSAASRVLRLRELRGRITALLARPEEEQQQLSLLGQLLRQADADVALRGGKLCFVFLPGMDLLLGRNVARERLARLVLGEVGDLGIPVLDVRRSFRGHELGSLFYYPDSHYSEVGNRVVAESVLSFLAEELAFPPPGNTP